MSRVAFLTSSLLACHSALAKTLHLVDPHAIQEVKDLYKGMLALMQGGPKEDAGAGGVTATMFGHQDDLLIGYTWPYKARAPFEDPPRSDVFSSTGRKLYPKVFGCDIGNIWKTGGRNVDGIHQEDIHAYVRRAHAMGGVITMTMHNDNPMTGRGYNDSTPGSVAAVLPGGKNHSQYLRHLGYLADFMKNFTNIPILFRPYHEANRPFWWGIGACSREEYIKLWIMTVHFLLNRTGWANNVLFVFSPQDAFHVNSTDLTSPDEYLSRYPGDEYVDVLGFDSYSLTWNVPFYNVVHGLTGLISYSRNLTNVRGMKPVAFTEAGYQYDSPSHLPTKFWTVLFDVFHATGYHLAWALVWRNTYRWMCHAPSPVPDGQGVCMHGHKDCSVCELPNFDSFLESCGQHCQLLPYAARRLQESPMLI